jgi:hypothetical protein
MGALAGGLGLIRGAGLGSELRRAVPVAGLSVLYGAAAACVALVAAGALLTATAVAVQGAAAANVVEGLDLEPAGALMSLVLLAAIAPNVVLLGASYLLGPGFALGTGTVVSPQEVVLGPVPSVPVLAALPPTGWAPEWVVALLALPVLAGLGGGVLAGRLLPTASYQAAVVRGLGAGSLAAALFAAAAAQAGGALGPGRMAGTGVDLTDTLAAGGLALTPAAALGALLATWWTRRRGDADAVHAADAAGDPDEEPTVPVVLPGRPTPATDDLSGEATVRLRLPGRRPPTEG